VSERVGYTGAGDLVVLLCRYRGFKSGPGWATQGTISACLWNLTSAKRSPFIEIGYGGIAVCPKGKLLAYRDGLWEIATGKKLRKVALPEGLVYEIVFSPDGKTVAYQISESPAQDFSLLFFADAATGKKVVQIGEIDLDRQRDRCRFFFGQCSRLTESGSPSLRQTGRPSISGTWSVARRSTASGSRSRNGWSGSRRTARPWSHGTGAAGPYACGKW
jgi:hypothetical protein